MHQAGLIRHACLSLIFSTVRTGSAGIKGPKPRRAGRHSRVFRRVGLSFVHERLVDRPSSCSSAWCVYCSRSPEHPFQQHRTFITARQHSTSDRPLDSVSIESRRRPSPRIRSDHPISPTPYPPQPHASVRHPKAKQHRAFAVASDAARSSAAEDGPNPRFSMILLTYKKFSMSWKEIRS